MNREQKSSEPFLPLILASTMKRPAETTEDFKARIAAIIGDKTEHIAGARPPHPMVLRKKRVIRAQKRRRR